VVAVPEVDDYDAELCEIAASCNDEEKRA